jgi:uncharacterized protein YraI
MKKVSNRGWKILMVIWLLVMACNLPIATPQSAEPTLSAQDLAATAISIALTAQAGDTAVVTPPEPTLVPTGLPPTLLPTVTLCVAMITANMDVNVRNGPGTAYDAVGYIPTGGTTFVAGQNDARTWWYIEFPSGSGRYAWVAGSVTTAACISPTLQIVAAPPLPTSVPPTATIVPPVVTSPDLYVSEYSWSPVPPHMGISFHVRVGVYNQGNGPAGSFTVQWWLSTSAPSATCTWHVASLVAHGGRILECDYTPGGWANYPSRVVVDSADTVDESNEGNNISSQTLQIKP